MTTDQASYLATHYLTADPKPKSKKRKRKDATASSAGLLITDDDSSNWGTSTANDDGDEGPLNVSGATAEFRKAKKSGWKPLAGGNGASTSAGNDDEAAAANVVLASAVAENNALRDQDDEMPQIENEGDDANIAKMSDGTHAGLQTAAAVSAQLKRRARLEREEFERHRKSAKEEETVYRDATGRRIDISMKRAEARRAAQEAEEKERAKVEALKGEVQQEQARKRREDLEEAKTMAFARGKDDEGMNRELKEKERWNDPMMHFMVDKAGQDRGGKSGKTRSKRPLYQGGAAPNRYGIRPGYRWDGVDRGNGFEGERFKALNRRERNKGLDYSWQMDE